VFILRAEINLQWQAKKLQRRRLFLEQLGEGLAKPHVPIFTDLLIIAQVKPFPLSLSTDWTLATLLIVLLKKGSRRLK